MQLKSVGNSFFFGYFFASHTKKKAQAEYAIARDELFGDVSIHNHLSTTSDQRTRMEQVTRTTANNSMLIDETKRSLDDSYSTGVDIMNMLSVQDEQIDRNREKVILSF